MDCTVRTGCKAMTKAGVNPMGGYAEEKKKTKWSRETRPVGCKPGRGSVSLDRMGSGAERKR